MDSENNSDNLTICRRMKAIAEKVGIKVVPDQNTPGWTDFIYNYYTSMTKERYSTKSRPKFRGGKLICSKIILRSRNIWSSNDNDSGSDENKRMIKDVLTKWQGGSKLGDRRTMPRCSIEKHPVISSISRSAYPHGQRTTPMGSAR